jgi:glycosyltransferase involved in cell wall biosynthesis
MSKDSYLLSILVPTRNRIDYAFETTKQILSIEDNRIQLIIQDNSDETILFNKLEIYKNDKRLKYNYIKEQLSFVDNFSHAVANADGEYICAIGDDDGINPLIGNIVEWAKANSISSVQYKLKAIYVWPGSGIYKNSRMPDNGNMVVENVTAKVYKADTILDLKKLFLNGCQNYLKLNMVKLYHGIVKKECLDEIKAKTGNYFNGLSPDIYSAVALSLVSKNNVFIDYPFTISGICKTSGSADSATGRHTGKWEDAPHFKGHSNYQWNQQVPKIYSVETIWADSAITAIKHFKHIEFNFNIAALTAYCLIRHPQYSKMLKKHYYNSVASRWDKQFMAYLKLIFNIVIGPGLDLLERIIRRIFRKKSDFVKFYNLENIGIAQKKLSNHLPESKFDEVLINLKKI